MHCGHLALSSSHLPSFIKSPPLSKHSLWALSQMALGNAPSGVSSYLENGPFTDFIVGFTEFDAVHQVLMHPMGLSPKQTGYSCRTEINVEKINLEDVGGDSSFLKDVSTAGCRIQHPRLPPLVCHRGYRPVPSHTHPYCNFYYCNCFAASYFFPQL